MKIETNTPQVTRGTMKAPTNFCNSCNNCSDNRCSVFERPVQDYNSCAYHSVENIFVKKYISPTQYDLDRIRDEEEREPKKELLELIA